MRKSSLSASFTFYFTVEKPIAAHSVYRGTNAKTFSHSVTKAEGKKSIFKMSMYTLKGVTVSMVRRRDSKGVTLFCVEI